MKTTRGCVSEEKCLNRSRHRFLVCGRLQHRCRCFRRRDSHCVELSHSHHLMLCHRDFVTCQPLFEIVLKYEGEKFVSGSCDSSGSCVSVFEGVQPVFPRKGLPNPLKTSIFDCSISHHTIISRLQAQSILPLSNIKINICCYFALSYVFDINKS